jgi:hypothetical protein
MAYSMTVYASKITWKVGICIPPTTTRVLRPRAPLCACTQHLMLQQPFPWLHVPSAHAHTSGCVTGPLPALRLAGWQAGTAPGFWPVPWTHACTDNTRSPGQSVSQSGTGCGTTLVQGCAPAEHQLVLCNQGCVRWLRSVMDANQ